MYARGRMTTMNPAKFIRTQVFGCTSQDEFASIFGTTQASVSRWERDGRIPAQKQEAVRSEALVRKLDWQDSWFFVVPEPQPAEAN